MTVHVAVFALDGSQVATASANCNSREKRFQSYGNKLAFTYKDARETINDCIAMAQKRASVRATRGALGLTPWLANEDEMSDSLEKPITPWTDAEKKGVMDAAAKKGMNRGAFASMVQTTLGTSHVGTGEDVNKLLNAIEKWVKPEPVKDAPKAEEREPGQE